MDGNEVVEPTTACPLKHGVRFHTSFGGRSNRDWWPNQLNLKILHQHTALSSPMSPAYSYAKELEKLDVEALKADLRALVTNSQLVFGSDYPWSNIINHSSALPDLGFTAAQVSALGRENGVRIASM